MEFPIINSRADLDAIYGTPAHVAFMRMLQASIWRLEKDDAARQWKAVSDTGVIERFGFTLDDFPGASAPALPEYADPPVVVPQSITRGQARAALIIAGLIDQVQPVIDKIADPIERALAQNDWDNRLTFDRNNPVLSGLTAGLGLTQERVDQLFIEAAKL